MKINKTLIEKINQSEWWHVAPQDPNAYKKRGKFLSSTYRQAEFYGRPNDIPEKVSIANPVYGTSEIEILKKLFPGRYKKLFTHVLDDERKDWYQRRVGLDAKMCHRAKYLGYDSIVLLGALGRRYLRRNRKPPSIELNLLCV